MPIGLQRLKDPHLLLGRQLCKYGGMLDLDGQFVLGEPLQFLACQSVHRIDASLRQVDTATLLWSPVSTRTPT